MRAGQGDTGGIATLLVHLGDALLADPGEVTRVVTISRGRAGDDPGPPFVEGPGHHYQPVPFWDPPVPAAESWPRRVATRRAVRRILSQAHVDVLHLRMADVGSWAGAEAARDLGIPVVLTLAPDPHASVAAREADGHLSRADLGRVDEVEHLVFRIRLLQELQRPGRPARRLPAAGAGGQPARPARPRPGGGGDRPAGPGQHRAGGDRPAAARPRGR